MPHSPLLCPRCRSPLPAGNGGDPVTLTTCPSCRQNLELTLLPGYGRELEVGRSAMERIGDSDAACYFHTTKKAELPCDRCGRFLCALCRLELNGQNLCPTCFGAGAKKGTLPSLERERFRWDNLAWILAVGPVATLCLWWLTPVTCIAALTVGVWKLNSPPSRIHRSRVRLILAMIVAALLLGAAVVGTLYLVIWEN